LRICTALSNFHRSLKNSRVTDGTSIGIETFLNSFNRGSKSIRRILASTALTSKDQTTYKTFIRVANISQMEIRNAIIFTSAWYNNSVPNKFREFLFKFSANSLPLNTRLSHFVINVQRNCTFCTLNNRVHDETFSHLFFECNTTQAVQRDFIEKFYPNITNTARSLRDLWFTGFFDSVHNHFVMYSILLFQYCIWEYKLKKKIPTSYSIRISFFHLMGQCYRVCKNMQYDRALLNFPLCRDWSTLNERYGDGGGV